MSSKLAKTRYQNREDTVAESSRCLLSGSSPFRGTNNLFAWNVWSYDISYGYELHILSSTLLYTFSYFFHGCINSCNATQSIQRLQHWIRHKSNCLVYFTMTPHLQQDNHQILPALPSGGGESSNLTPRDLSHARHHALITSPACCERRGRAWVSKSFQLNMVKYDWGHSGEVRLLTTAFEHLLFGGIFNNSQSLLLSCFVKMSCKYVAHCCTWTRHDVPMWLDCDTGGVYYNYIYTWYTFIPQTIFCVSMHVHCCTVMTACTLRFIAGALLHGDV